MFLYPSSLKGALAVLLQSLHFIFYLRLFNEDLGVLIFSITEVRLTYSNISKLCGINASGYILNTAHKERKMVYVWYVFKFLKS